MTGSPRARVGLISLGVGLAAAGLGAAVGLAAERAAMGRPVLPRRGRARSEDYGSVRGEQHTVAADDGTELYVEVDEADPRATLRSDPPSDAQPDTQSDGATPRTEPAAPPITVVLCHGYSLTMDAWHYQRKALRGRYRVVLWDQRGHGRSASGEPASATIDQAGRDLARVLDAVAPDGPLILVGHSMGGMAIMSLAHEQPELFADRVLGVALVSTSAGGLGSMDLGIAVLGRFVPRLVPGTAALLARKPGLVDRGRRLGSDLETVLVRRYSFASPVPEELVRFCAEMIAATRFKVISDFLPAFGGHDKREALAALDGIEVLVLVGDGDLITPVAHSEEIVRMLPGAEHVIVASAGHLVMLEHPGVVNAHLDDLVRRAVRAAGHRGRRPGRGDGKDRVSRPRSVVTPLRRRGRRHGAA
ncbi:MAG: alpha/beta hydrolase [Actinomycetales bacterium]|nr:alpha/beta hydrolase [Actinomycetales bacterium]